MNYDQTETNWHLVFPPNSVAFSSDGMVLYAATEGGFVVGWCRQDKEKEGKPLLITFLDAGNHS